MRAKLFDAANMVLGSIISGTPEALFSGVSTDSRTLDKGELFIALRGDNFDGHDYILQAVQRGAAAAIVEKPDYAKDIPCILVENTMNALWTLAAGYRRQFSLKVAGITGSAGKTTVKEMVASILSDAGCTLKTNKNFNNLIGVPMRLFDLSDKYEYAVIEMGTNSPGEIERLAHIALPDVSVITGIAPAHLMGLHSMEGIIREKQSIFEHTTKTAVYDPNGEYTSRLSIPAGLDRVTFSITGNADVKLINVASHDLYGSVFKADFGGKEYKIRVNLPGMHNIGNALAASATAFALGIEPEAIAKGIDKTVFPGMRSEIVVSDGLTIIDDSYNANPGSMKAALELLNSAPHSVKIAVIGDMLELGEDSAYWHGRLGTWIAGIKPDRLIVTGKMADTVKEAAYNAGLEIMRITVAPDIEDIKKALSSINSKDTIVLVKASRSLKLDRVVEFLKEAA